MNSGISGSGAGEVGIGTRVWEFDTNRRVYRKDSNGRGRGGPIYAEHFSPLFIIGEEARSWLLAFKPDDTRPFVKVGKNRMQGRYFTDAEREAAIWIADNRFETAQAVMRCPDVALLKQVAQLVGYQPQEPSDD